MQNQRTVRPRVGRPIGIEDITLEDLEAVRLLLRGNSVIDWHQLDLRDHAAVDRFLRVNEFDPESDKDMARLDALREESVDYLLRTFQFPIPDEVAIAASARDLLLMASRPSTQQRAACVVLKVMHIIHHLAGRELMMRLPISDDEIFRAVELKVMQVVEELRSTGFAIDEFSWSRKPRDSLITKLLAKKSTLAAQIYDKLRFRLIVPRYEDLFPILAVLTRQVIPFNYVIPGATVNHLVPFERAVSIHPPLASLVPQLPPDDDEESGLPEKLEAPINEFSAEAYRIINFVCDMPVRVDGMVPEELLAPESGHVVFVLTEFQLADKHTSLENETGESSHSAYKARQLRRVRARLEGSEE